MVVLGDIPKVVAVCALLSTVFVSLYNTNAISEVGRRIEEIVLQLQANDDLRDISSQIVSEIEKRLKSLEDKRLDKTLEDFKKQSDGKIKTLEDSIKKLEDSIKKLENNTKEILQTLVKDNQTLYNEEIARKTIQNLNQSLSLILKELTELKLDWTNPKKELPKTTDDDDDDDDYDDDEPTTIIPKPTTATKKDRPKNNPPK